MQQINITVADRRDLPSFLNSIADELQLIHQRKHEGNERYRVAADRIREAAQRTKDTQIGIT